MISTQHLCLCTLPPPSNPDLLRLVFGLRYKRLGPKTRTLVVPYTAASGCDPIDLAQHNRPPNCPSPYGNLVDPKRKTTNATVRCSVSAQDEENVGRRFALFYCSPLYRAHCLLVAGDTDPRLLRVGKGGSNGRWFQPMALLQLERAGATLGLILIDHLLKIIRTLTGHGRLQ